MNNLTLGEETWGYYETVAGGSGAVSVVIIKSHNY
jgi:N-methylhydantoinase B/oxoprolinase/acetone carboxylase alpha subunit